MEKELQKDLFGNVIVKNNVYENKSTKTKKDLSNSIETKFVIEIECIDENEQEMMYNELIKKGFECKILTL